MESSPPTLHYGIRERKGRRLQFTAIVVIAIITVSLVGWRRRADVNALFVRAEVLYYAHQCNRFESDGATTVFDTSKPIFEFSDDNGNTSGYGEPKEWTRLLSLCGYGKFVMGRQNDMLFLHPLGCGADRKLTAVYVEFRSPACAEWVSRPSGTALPCQVEFCFLTFASGSINETPGWNVVWDSPQSTDSLRAREVRLFAAVADQADSGKFRAKFSIDGNEGAYEGVLGSDGRIHLHMVYGPNLNTKPWPGEYEEPCLWPTNKTPQGAARVIGF